MTQISVVNTLKPDKELIQLLEDFLKDAKLGDITSIAIVAGHHDGCSSYAWSGLINARPIIGAMEEMKFDILSRRET